MKFVELKSKACVIVLAAMRAFTTLAAYERDVKFGDVSICLYLAWSVKIMVCVLRGVFSLFSSSASLGQSLSYMSRPFSASSLRATDG